MCDVVKEMVCGGVFSALGSDSLYFLFLFMCASICAFACLRVMMCGEVMCALSLPNLINA